MNQSKLLLLSVLLYFLSFTSNALSQDNRAQVIWYKNQEYPLYPQKLDMLPDIASPFVTDEGIEVLIVELKNNQFALISVTVENGSHWFTVTELMTFSARINNFISIREISRHWHE